MRGAGEFGGQRSSCIWATRRSTMNARESLQTRFQGVTSPESLGFCLNSLLFCHSSGAPDIARVPI